MNISIIMASYNGEKYIKEQLDSIVPYMEVGDELIISDDGSTDRTREIINEYVKGDKRIKLIQGPGKGVIKNFEYALNQTTKEIILFADQDDIWLQNKLPTIRRYFENGDKELILHDMFIASDEEIIDHKNGVRSFEIRKRRHGVFYNWIYSGYYGCCMAFTDKIKNIILPFSQYVNMYDQWIGLIAEHIHSSCFIEEALIIHRNHGNNMSKKLSLMDKIKVRYNSYKAYKDTINKMKRGKFEK